MEKSFKGEITYRTHSVSVELQNGRIYCFKHNDETCDIKIFEDYDEMIEWTLEPFPSITFSLVMDDE